MFDFFKSLITHPLARGIDIDAPETTEARIEIIQSKSFLVQIYHEWYQQLLANVPNSMSGQILELGSGAGFLKQLCPEAITSDIFFIPKLDVVFDAKNIPFSRASLKSILMTNVLHHIPNVEKFFYEASRCVQPGGAILMIEPWVTKWSRFVYSHLHHEPFHPDQTNWEFPNAGPLSGANGALPWILFERDRERFAQIYPEWEIKKIRLIMPFRYLLSGGVSMRNLMPGWTFKFWKMLENVFSPILDHFAMFALIVLIRKD